MRCPLSGRLMRGSRYAPVAQLDRAPDYESGGQEFESLRARHFTAGLNKVQIERSGGPFEGKKAMRARPEWRRRFSEALGKGHTRRQDAFWGVFF